MDELDCALARVEKARIAEREALDALHDVIRRLIAAGPRGTQATVAKRTGYTRERLRQIVRNKARFPES